jgi:5'-methylthioadenosine nucleosidase
MVRTVLVVMAMDVEAAPVRAALGTRPLARPDWVGPMPFSWWEAERSGGRVVLSVNGRDPRHGVDAIGTEAAALATFAAARAVAPDLVVSAGTAGGWQRHGAAVGDVYLSGDRFVYHDRRIDLPGFDAYGVGSWPGVDTSGLAAQLGLRRGIVTSGDSLDESAEDAVRIRASGAEVKEMEAAAVAWVADLLRIPVLAVKAVTDLVDHPAPTAEQFTANLAVATERLRDAVVAVLDEVVGRPLGSPPA